MKHVRIHYTLLKALNIKKNEYCTSGKSTFMVLKVINGRGQLFLLRPGFLGGAVKVEVTWSYQGLYEDIMLDVLA